jgi:negative regulator of flagellin synthesis FlgM
VRISNEQVQQILAAQGTKGTKALKGVEGPGAAGATDALSMSAMGQELGKVLGTLSSLPDIRADKVAALKAQIEAGTYHVPGTEIARSVLQHAEDLRL